MRWPTHRPSVLLIFTPATGTSMGTVHAANAATHIQEDAHANSGNRQDSRHRQVSEKRGGPEQEDEDCPVPREPRARTREIIANGEMPDRPGRCVRPNRRYSRQRNANIQYLTRIRRLNVRPTIWANGASWLIACAEPDATKLALLKGECFCLVSRKCGWLAARGGCQVHDKAQFPSL